MVFVGDIVPDALMEVPGDALHLAAWHEVENPVQKVRAPVVERPAGEGFIRAPPVAGMAVAGEAGLDGEDVSDQLFLDNGFLEGQEVAVVTTVVEHGEQQRPLFRRRDHGGRFGGGEAHRLFADHGLSRLEGFDRQCGVAAMGGDDRHQVDLRIGQQRWNVGIGAQAGIVLGGGGRAGGVEVTGGDRHDPGIAHPAQVAPAHVERPAIADHGSTNKFFAVHNCIVSVRPGIVKLRTLLCKM